MSEEAKIREGSGANPEREVVAGRFTRLRANKALRSAVRAFLFGLVSFGPVR
jgi:hypothetical protein